MGKMIFFLDIMGIQNIRYSYVIIYDILQFDHLCLIF